MVDIITAADAGPTQPFFFGASTLYRVSGASKAVTVAAVSGSSSEDHAYMWDPTTFDSKIFIRRDNNGVVDATQDYLTVPIQSLCVPIPAQNYTVWAGCTAPSARAKPVTDPILLGDLGLTTGTVELLLLYQDPPPAASACTAPDSWFIHIKSTGAAKSVINTVKFAGADMTGMMIVGSGGSREVFFSQSGKGANPAGVTQRTTQSVTGAGSLYGTPIIESWREVQ